MLNNARPGVPLRDAAYENFGGLDSSRDSVAKENPRNQSLDVLNNAYCDWRGQIVRDPATLWRSGNQTVTHLNFIAPDEVVYVERLASGVGFRSERKHVLTDIHPPETTVTSTVFNRRVQLFAKGRPTYRYNGTIYERNQSPSLNENLLPGFGVSVQRRLAVSGIPSRPTQVHISRVDNEDVMPDDEDPNSNSVLRAGLIDIANLIGTSDTISGLGFFEQNRLVIFTTDRALIYTIDPDITEWSLDSNANIQNGCISHATIANAGTDLLYCSRSGIHSIKRSEQNGILVSSYSMSDKVDLLYRSLLAKVPNKSEVSAVFDQDRAQYHVFFPLPGGLLCNRLTVSLNAESGEPNTAFSTGNHLNARAGASLSGKLVFGTSGGVHTVLPEDENAEGAITPSSTITTPMLWHQELTEQKQTHSLIVSASGRGIIEISAVTDEGINLGSLRIEVDDDPDDNAFGGVALSRQYERQWQHRYRGARYTIKTIAGEGLLRITGLGVRIRKI